MIVAEVMAAIAAPAAEGVEAVTMVVVTITAAATTDLITVSAS
jgi:hypothetical protein